MIGRQLYGVQWLDGYSGQGALPDIVRAKQLVIGGGPEGEVVRPLLAHGDEAYEEIQRRRYREAQAFRSLLNALEWGKTHAWRKDEGAQWQPILAQAWAADADLRRALRMDVAAYWQRADLPSRNILVDKERLDSWLPNIVPPLAESPIAAREAKPIGRPGIKTDALIAELRALHRGENLPPIERGWREEICGTLQGWYAQQYPGERPAIKTIKRHLKAEFDRIERQNRRETTP